MRLLGIRLWICRVGTYHSWSVYEAVHGRSEAAAEPGGGYLGTVPTVHVLACTVHTYSPCTFN